MENISCYVSEEEKSLLSKASKFQGLKLSAFLRYLAVKESNKILQEQTQ